MRIINLTPHDITIINAGGEVEVFPKSGFIARCETEKRIDRYINDIPVYRMKVGNVYIASETDEKFVYDEDALYIVSSLVLSSIAKKNFVAPDTSEAIRGESGQILGVPGFVIKTKYYNN